MTAKDHTQTIHVQVNGDPMEFPAGACCADVLERLGIPEQQRLAMEVNETIVPRSQLSQRTLVDGDRVEVIQAIGGG